MKAVYDKLEELESEIGRLKKEYDKATKYKQYYVLECSSMEEHYWSRSFRKLRNQINDLIDEWELEVIGLSLSEKDHEN